MRVHLNKIMVGAAVLLVFLIVFILIQKNHSEENVHSFELFDELDEHIEDSNDLVQDEQIVVDIKGEVMHAGVYEMDQTDRVYDVIEKAGGFTNEAAKDYVNLAERVYDAMVIRIPNEKEVESLDFGDLYTMDQSTSNDQNSSDMIHLNEASETELQTLPGIGPAKAKAIITYREENGPFQTEEELMEVSGIGEKTFESLKDHIRVR